MFGPDEEEEISDAETLTTSSDSEESLDDDFEDLTYNLSSSEESDKDQVKKKRKLLRRVRQRKGTQLSSLESEHKFAFLRVDRESTVTEILRKVNKGM